MGEIIRNGESYSGIGGESGSAVTGVKGDNETAYRTGDVNLTPENIGAISTEDVQKGIPLKEDTVFSPFEASYYLLAEIIPSGNGDQKNYNSPITFEVTCSGVKVPYMIYLQFYWSSGLHVNFNYTGYGDGDKFILVKSVGKYYLYFNMNQTELQRTGSVAITRFSNPNYGHADGVVVNIDCNPTNQLEDGDKITPNKLSNDQTYDLSPYAVRTDKDNIIDSSLVLGRLTGINTGTVMWQDQHRKIWAGIKNGNGAFYVWDATHNKSVLISHEDGTNTFDGYSVGTIDVGDSNYITLAYSLPELPYSSYTWIAAWNGRQLRAVHKSQFVATQSSSKRYKTNIKPITKERARRILDVEIETFDYKNGVVDDGEQYDRTGAIAEDVAEIYPEAVIFRDIEGLGTVPDAIDYSRLIPSMIKMAQLQQEEINALKKRVMDLESES